MSLIITILTEIVRYQYVTVILFDSVVSENDKDMIKDWSKKVRYIIIRFRLKFREKEVGVG